MGVDKYGNPSEMNRVMASDMCPACGSMLLATADGKVCLTCSQAKANVEQNEKPWDEYRRQAEEGRTWDQAMREHGAEFYELDRQANESVPEETYARIRDQNNEFQIAEQQMKSVWPEAQASPVAPRPIVQREREIAEILRLVKETRDELVAIYSKLSQAVQQFEQKVKEVS